MSSVHLGTLWHRDRITLFFACLEILQFGVTKVVPSNTDTKSVSADTCCFLVHH